MDFLYAINNPTPAQIAGAYGFRWGDPMYDKAYSNLTPDDIRECAYRCIKGDWYPLHVYGGQTLLAAHHLYHIEPAIGTSWCSGMVLEPGRGRSPWQIDLRKGLWKVIYAECVKRLLPSIFCYALGTNTAAQEWIAVCCEFTPVGLMRHAVPEDERMVDIVVYSYLEKDMEECRRQAERLFPEGRWDR